MAGFDGLVVCFVGLSCRVLCFVIGWWISGLWAFSFSDVLGVLWLIWLVSLGLLRWVLVRCLVFGFSGYSSGWVLAGIWVWV